MFFAANLITGLHKSIKSKQKYYNFYNYLWDKKNDL